MSIFSKLASAVKSTAKAIKSTAKAVGAKVVSSAAKVTASVAKTVSKVSTAVAKVSSTVAKAAAKVAANSNCKLVKSIANGVAKTANKVTKAANKVTKVAKKVEKTSTQVAKKYDKIAEDSWTEAKKHYASAAKDFNDAKKEAKQAIACAATKAGEFVKSTVKSAVEYCKQNPLEAIHGALDIIGMIPALGTVADALNTAVYLAQGDLANAAMSAISLIPLGGAVAAAGALFAKYGDEIVQAAVKHGDELAEAAYKNGEKAVDLFTDVSKKTDNADEIADLCKNGACFVAGTLILTTEGYKPIEDIEEGDVVIATDPDTGETTEKKVVETFVNETDELIYLTVNGEEIITTPTHPFYVPEKGWTDAEDLRAGDMLVLVNGNYVVIERTEHEILEQPITVYNFEVEDFHTYYVGEQSLLVHNAKCPNDSPLSYTYKNGKYEKADYHSGKTTGRKDPAPVDGQFALDNSVPIGENTPRRVGLDVNGDFVVLDQTSPGVFHGHVRKWNSAGANKGLSQEMKNALYEAGYVKSSKGSSFKLTDASYELIGKK